MRLANYGRFMQSQLSAWGGAMTLFSSGLVNGARDYSLKNEAHVWCALEKRSTGRVLKST